MTTGAVPRFWTAGGSSQIPDAPVHEQFLARARRHPDALAVRQWDQSLTYGQLAALAATLAPRLRAAGVHAGSRVGICMKRTPWLPASMLGVLAAGGAFVPLDLGQPAERIRAMIGKCRIESVLVDDAGSELLRGTGVQLIDAVAASASSAAEASTSDAADDRSPGPGPASGAAYVMFTSGSTGQPKGVAVSHRNLAAFACAANRCLGADPGIRLAAFAANGWDVSIFELFTPLVAGGSIQLVPDEDRTEAHRLQRFLEAHAVTRALLPPALLPLLDPDRLPELRDIIAGGDRCDPAQVGRWARAGLRRFHNWYGPTEATVAVTGIELRGSHDQPLPLGRPLPGNRLYIVTEDMTMCRPGQEGELLIGGPQVALGYEGDPALSAQRFVADHFYDEPGADAGADRRTACRLYRTGDLARWDDDGLIWFLGRADRQVKIRGQRVEIAEIEAVLAGHPRIHQAAVDVAGPELHAFVTAQDAPPPDELRAYCAARLPRYMVPSRFTPVAGLPLTRSGKVDVAALRGLAPARAARPAPRREARTALEVAVAESWLAVLGQPRPGLDDDFFLAAGDSLSAMRLASALRRATGRDVQAGQVFAGRTVAGIAAELAATGQAPGNELPHGSPARLSAAQRGLWLVEQIAPGTPVHNIVMAEQVSGPLEVTALASAFRDVAARQSALRWRLHLADGEPQVVIAEPADVPVPVTDLSAMTASEQRAAVSSILEEEASSPVDLTGTALWRIRLLRLGQQQHILAMTFHHVIFDGWSQDILYAELSAAYQRQLDAGRGLPAAPPAPPPVTFADYVAWTSAPGANPGTGTGAAWWERHLAGVPAVLDLPRDRPRPTAQAFSGDRCSTALDPDLTKKVARLAAAEETTVGAVLLAGFGVLLRRLTGERDLVIGVPVADRGRAELEHLIGFLIRTLPLRLTIDDEGSFTDHLRQVREEMAAARHYADVPLERIVERLRIGRDLSRNPLFQVMFNVYNFRQPRLHLTGMVARPLQAALPGSIVDLTMYVCPAGERPDDVRLEVVYNSDLYSRERVHALLDSYIRLLGDLTGNAGRPVGTASARADQTLLPDWQAPLTSKIPAGPGLVELVSAMAGQAPDRVAARDHAGSITYGRLVGLSGRLAAALRAVPVRQGGVVAVLAEREAILPAVLLGIMSAGARWAILDPDLPAGVLERRLAAVAPQALIRFGGDMAAAEPAELPVIHVADLYPGRPGDPDIPHEPAEAAGRGYLTFTSGSTGEPKVIEAAEAPLVHFLHWYAGAFGLSGNERFALLSGLAHDPVLRDIFTPLVCGAVLEVPDPGLLRDPSRLLAWLDQRKITVAHVSPQLLRLLAAAPNSAARTLPALSLVTVTGDQLTEGDVAELRLMAPGALVVNFYGTSETPQAQACYAPSARQPVTSRDELLALRTMPVPVGAGIDGVQLLVMSVTGQPAAVGELGEIVIRSAHLADGYLGQPADSGDFAPLPGAEPGRVYRTGDLGRYDPAGQVTLAGRKDDQVKVRGFRVQLGEVEAVLRSYPDVGQAAVRLLERDGATSLHAYVAAADAVIAESDLLRFLRSRLPGYAVPSSITQMPTLPLTPSGKVNRALLPAPRSRIGPPAEALQPEGDVERTLAGIWRDVLGLPRVSRDDNFFEIGGHSMAIIKVQSRLEHVLGRHVPVVDLFTFPTIRDLAGHLAAGGEGQQRASGQDDDTVLLADLRGSRRRRRAGRLAATREKDGSQ